MKVIRSNVRAYGKDAPARGAASALDGGRNNLINKRYKEEFLQMWGRPPTPPTRLRRKNIKDGQRHKTVRNFSLRSPSVGLRPAAALFLESSSRRPKPLASATSLARSVGLRLTRFARFVLPNSLLAYTLTPHPTTISCLWLCLSPVTALSLAN